VESAIDPLAFDAQAARRYGYLVAAVVAAGQQHRPRRLDLMIAATASANGLPLYTRNPKDVTAVAGDVRVFAV
jgi:toxin FitB